MARRAPGHLLFMNPLRLLALQGRRIPVISYVNGAPPGRIAALMLECRRRLRSLDYGSIEDRSAAHAIPGEGPAPARAERERRRPSRCRDREKEEAARDHAAVRPDRPGPPLQSAHRRGVAQPGLRLRHEGPWRA